MSASAAPTTSHLVDSAGARIAVGSLADQNYHADEEWGEVDAHVVASRLLTFAW